MENFYNQIANNYNNIAKKKNQFLAGVNKILISKLRSRKKILDIGKNLNGFILILDLLNLNFRKVRLKKHNLCLCK